MDLKIACVALLAVFCCSQVVTGALTPEAEKAQYAVVKHATEATIFRMRAYSVALEMNYSVKMIDKKIVANFVELGADMEPLIAELEKKSVLINENILRIMDYSSHLITTLETTNNHIVNTPTALETDQLLINSAVSNVNLGYDLGINNIQLSIQIIKMMMNSELANVDREDPLAEEIVDLMAEAEAILVTEADAMAASKVILDVAAANTQSSMEDLIASLAPAQYHPRMTLAAH